MWKRKYIAVKVIILFSISSNKNYLLPYTSCIFTMIGIMAGGHCSINSILPLICAHKYILDQTIGFYRNMDYNMRVKSK